MWGKGGLGGRFKLTISNFSPKKMYLSAVETTAITLEAVFYNSSNL